MQKKQYENLRKFSEMYDIKPNAYELKLNPH